MATEKRGLILVVDDEEEQSFALATFLESRGFDCVTANSAKQAQELVQEYSVSEPSKRSFDLALLDVNMPGERGTVLASKLPDFPATSRTPIIFLTGEEFSEVAPYMRDGVVDYIRKPVDLNDLIGRLEVVLRTAAMQRALQSEQAENRALRRLNTDRSGYTNIVGESVAIRRVIDLLIKLEESEVPVLITGESGTGKELIARAIHAHSMRKDAPLMVQNCAALNENLLESELFGHVKGAFTGALKDKSGLFDVADKGTLFLDEVGEMTASLQAKLLRVLQDGSYSPVGASVLKFCDVRIVAATNRDLETMVQRGEFREDLYYRLNVFRVELPPLRARQGDVLLVAQHLLSIARQRASERGRPINTTGFSQAALKAMERYNWPGNIRQMENEIERAIIMSSGKQEIDLDSLSDRVRAGPDQDLPNAEGELRPLNEMIEDLEKAALRSALKVARGNRSEVARLLRISRTSVVSKIAQYGLEDQ